MAIGGTRTIVAARHGSAPLAGIALIVGAALCFTLLDTTIRYLGPLMPVLVLLWARYAIQALLMGGWIVVDARKSFRSRHPRFQLLRGVLLLASSAFGFFALQYMPVPEFTSINMLTPVLVTLLAVWLLGERVSRLRWILVCLCLVGALIVIRPGSGLFGWAALLPAGAAVSYALFQVLTRRLSGQDSPYTTHFYTGLVGALAMSALLLAIPLDVLPALRGLHAGHLTLLAGAGLLATIGHLLLVFALDQAPASTLMPFLYVQIALAALVSWLVFGTLPDGWSWLGMTIIGGCGAASGWLDMRRAQSALEVDPATE